MEHTRQSNIFRQDIISSIGYDEQEIIRNILFLHADGNNIDCDPTYSTGNFYKHGLTPPIHKFDKYPQIHGVVEACSESLPLDDGTCNVIMFDPPFVIAGVKYKTYEHGSSIIAKRFEGFRNFNELKVMYFNSLKEFYRILKFKGIVIFKCQDTVSSGKNHFTHSMVMNMAIDIGYYPLDLFILLANNRINAFNGSKWKIQQHARKYHCYYWVLKKQTSRVDYT